jgi:hypothetical protein
LGDEQIIFDFNAPYQHLFEEASYGTDVNYDEPPISFERYTASDQEKIMLLMQHLKA